MTENDCMTLKQLIARWNGLKQTKEGHVKFTLEIPHDANLNEICRRRVSDEFNPPGLYFRWFKDGNRPTAALIRELVENEQLTLYKYGRRVISGGKWVYEVEPTPRNAVKSKGASSLLVSRNAVAEIEKNFYDPAMLLRLDIEAERDWQRYAWQVAEQNKAAMERIKQRNNPKVLPTERKPELVHGEKSAENDLATRIPAMIERARRSLWGTNLDGCITWFTKEHYADDLQAAILFHVFKFEKNEIGKHYSSGSTESAFSQAATKLITRAEKKYTIDVFLQ